MIKKSDWVWKNGQLVPWEQATVHVLSHALHYGTSVFEGIRLYKKNERSCFFRLKDHIVRLIKSARIYEMPLKYSLEELMSACHEIITKNQLQSAYIRPIVFYGYGTLGVLPSVDTPVEVCIAAFSWESYHGKGTIEKGIDTMVSSWQRVAPNTLPALAKVGGHYCSSVLMVTEANRLGYQEAIALNTSGFLSEGSGENLFLVKDDTLYTPSLDNGILDGITRSSILTLAEQHGYSIKEASLPREMLYISDEIFLTGTAAEIVPVKSVDGRKINGEKTGPVTLALQKLFFGLFNGSTKDKWNWLEPVNLQIK